MSEHTPTGEPIRLRGAGLPPHSRPEVEDGDDLVTQALVKAAHDAAATADDAEKRREQARQEADRWDEVLGRSREALRAITEEVGRRRDASAPIQMAPGQALHARAVPPATGLDPRRVGVQ